MEHQSVLLVVVRVLMGMSVLLFVLSFVFGWRSGCPEYPFCGQLLSSLAGVVLVVGSVSPFMTSFCSVWPG
jgi:hypothetical protein